MAVPYIYIYRFSSPRAVKTIQSNRNGCKFGRVVPSRRLAENGNTWSHDHSPISAVFLSPRIAQGVIKVCAPRCIQPTPHKHVVDIWFYRVLRSSFPNQRGYERGSIVRKRKLCPLSINFPRNSDKQTRFDAFPICARTWNNIVFHASTRSELLKLIQVAMVN